MYYFLDNVMLCGECIAIFLNSQVAQEPNHKEPDSRYLIRGQEIVQQSQTCAYTKEAKILLSSNKASEFCALAPSDVMTIKKRGVGRAL